jgi:hypothetical protein
VHDQPTYEPDDPIAEAHTAHERLDQLIDLALANAQREAALLDLAIDRASCICRPSTDPTRLALNAGCPTHGTRPRR